MTSGNPHPFLETFPTRLSSQVEGRFGVLPNFFRLAPETPEITEKLWGFAQAAYLDNPMPSVFKERLFVHLSRFCAVRYCIARHVGFLIGLGRPAGDAAVQPQSIVDVVHLLRRPFPRDPELQLRLSGCMNCPAPLDEMPAPDSELEDALFTLAGHVFLQTSDASACLDTMERVHFAVFTASCLARAGSLASRVAGKIFVKICRKRVPHAAFPSEDYCK